MPLKMHDSQEPRSPPTAGFRLNYPQREFEGPLSPWGYGIQTSDSKGKYGFFHSEKAQHFQGYWGVYPQSCPAQPLLQPIDFSEFSNLFESRSPLGRETE
jgi:hypothetical protein